MGVDEGEEGWERVVCLRPGEKGKVEVLVESVEEEGEGEQGFRRRVEGFEREMVRCGMLGE